MRKINKKAFTLVELLAVIVILAVRSLNNINLGGCLFYYARIKVNSILVRNMIPCYRIADNIAGMYDTVNNVFYTNQGTGTFIVGPDVAY